MTIYPFILQTLRSPMKKITPYLSRKESCKKMNKERDMKLAKNHFFLLSPFAPSKTKNSLRCHFCLNALLRLWVSFIRFSPVTHFDICLYFFIKYFVKFIGHETLSKAIIYVCIDQCEEVFFLY